MTFVSVLPFALRVDSTMLPAIGFTAELEWTVSARQRSSAYDSPDTSDSTAKIKVRRISLTLNGMIVHGVQAERYGRDHGAVNL
jgi:hypothetical protein